MSAPTRRGLLGGAAALASAPVVSAAAPVHPDAELLEVCAEFDGWERTYRATDFEASRDTPAGEAAQAKRQQCAETQEPLLVRMVEIRPATLAGHAARARSAVVSLSVV